MKPKLKLVENIASSTAPQKIVIQKGVVIKKKVEEFMQSFNI